MYSLKDVPTIFQVLLSHSGRMLFTGTSNGSVRAMKYPFGHDAGESHEHQAHYGTVTKMRLSIDDQYLFSASEDGSLYIFRVTDKESKLNKRDREIEYADEILVTKTDLEGKDALMSDLKARVEELKMENEYQLRLKDLTFSEKIKDATDHFSREIEALKATARDLRSEKEKEEVRHMQDVAAENEMHAKEMMELETVHSAKILAEYEKFQELQNKTTEMQQKWETQLAEMDEAREQALAELTNHYEEKLKEKQAEIEKLQEEMRTQIRDFEEMTKDTEEDADTEVMEIKNRYEKKLQEEKESGQRLKGENAIMKKKFNTLHTEIESHKADIQKMYAEEKKLHNIIKALEKDTVGLKKEVWLMR